MTTTILTCEVGKVLYEVWSNLLNQKKPKASSLEISSAKWAYTTHVKLCEKCKIING